MDDIDLTLPGFLRAENREPPPQTQKRRSETTSIAPKAVSGKSKRRPTKETAGAEAGNGH